MPEHGSPRGLGGDEVKVGLPGIQFNGIPGPKMKKFNNLFNIVIGALVINNSECVFRSQ